MDNKRKPPRPDTLADEPQMSDQMRQLITRHFDVEAAMFFLKNERHGTPQELTQIISESLRTVQKLKNAMSKKTRKIIFVTELPEHPGELIPLEDALENLLMIVETLIEKRTPYINGALAYIGVMLNITACDHEKTVEIFKNKIGELANKKDLGQKIGHMTMEEYRRSVEKIVYEFQTVREILNSLAQILPPFSIVLKATEETVN